MSSEIVLLARHPRPRWRAPVGILVVLGAVIAGLLAAVAPALAVDGVVEGVAFHDRDRDGALDDGETMLGGHEIELWDMEGVNLGFTRTAADGSYRFSGVPDGNYEVRYALSTWSSISPDWTPTTTGSLYARQQVALSGTAVVHFGWRRIVASTAYTEPLSTYGGPSGLVVKSYNDVMTAREIHDRIAVGLVGEEAPTIEVRFAWGQAAYTGYTVGGLEGDYVNFSARVEIPWTAWLANSDTVLFHEYGHAWSQYYAHMVQQDTSLAGYLDARGLASDPRVGTEYQWDRDELIADDYRQLFGPAGANEPGFLNDDVPPAGEVDGLEAYLRVEFTSPATSTTDSKPATEPAEDTQAPDVRIASPSDGSRVSGSVTVEVRASDDVDEVADLQVDVRVDDGSWVPAQFDVDNGGYVLPLDTTILDQGMHVLSARAVDSTGNATAAPSITLDVKNRGGGAGGTNGPGGGKGKNK